MNLSQTVFMRMGWARAIKAKNRMMPRPTSPMGFSANRAALAREKVRQQIALETKEGLRRVRTDFQRIATTRRARALAEKKLSAGNERFNLGLISSHDLLEFQNELADARGKELKAVTDYNKSLANLEKVTGLLSDRYPISAAPEAPR